MASFLERDQLLPSQPYISDTQGTLGVFKTALDLYGTGAGELAAAQRKYMNLELLHPQDKQDLDSLMGGVDSTLKKTAQTNLGVFDNVKTGLGAFDPVIGNRSIMGDHAYTIASNQELEKAEQDRIRDGGKGFNQASYDYIKAGQQLFASSPREWMDNKGNKIPAWQVMLNNKGEYNSAPDTTEEMNTLQKMFKTDVIDKDTTKGGYIFNSKDSSWYKGKWQAFVEANASSQLKNQIALQGKADYRKMMVMYKDNPQAIHQYYQQEYQGLKRSKTLDLDNSLNEATIKLNSLTGNEPNYSQIKAQLQTTIDNIQGNKERGITGQLEQLNNDKGVSPDIADLSKLSQNEAIAGSIESSKYFDKIGSAFAHKEIHEATRMDGAYWANQKLQMDMTQLREDAREHNDEMGFKYKNMAQQWDIAQLNNQTELLKAGMKLDAKTGQMVPITQDYATNNATANETDKIADGKSVIEARDNLAANGYNTIYGEIQGQYFGNQSFVDNLAKAGNTKLSQIVSEGGVGSDLQNKVAKFVADSYWGTGLYNRMGIDMKNPQEAKQKMIAKLMDTSGSEVKALLNTIMSHPKIKDIMMNTVGDKEGGIVYGTKLQIAQKELEGTLKGYDEAFAPRVAKVLEKYNFPKSLYTNGDGTTRIPTNDEIFKYQSAVVARQHPMLTKMAEGDFNYIKSVGGPEKYLQLLKQQRRGGGPNEQEQQNIRDYKAAGGNLREFIQKKYERNTDIGKIQTDIYRAIGENGGVGLNGMASTTYVNEKNRGYATTQLMSIVSRLNDDNTDDSRQLAEIIRSHSDVISNYTISGTGLDGNPKLSVSFDSDKMKALGWTPDDVKKFANVKIGSSSELIPERFRVKDPEYVNLMRAPKSLGVDFNYGDKVTIPTSSQTISIKNQGTFDNPKFEITGGFYVPKRDGNGNFVYKDNKLDIDYISPAEFTAILDRQSGGKLSETLQKNPSGIYKFATGQTYAYKNLIDQVIKRNAINLKDIPANILNDIAGLTK